MAIQQIGGAINSVREVELNSLAARAVMRQNPGDISHGAFSFSFGASAAFTSGIGAVTAQKIAGFQWISPTNLCVIKKINASINQFNTAGTNQGILKLTLTKASAYVQQFDTYSTDGSVNIWLVNPAVKALTIGAGNKLRSTMSPTDAGGYQPSDIANASIPTGGGGVSVGTTVPGTSVVFGLCVVTASTGYPGGSGGLPGGQFTLDAQPFATFVTSVMLTPTATRQPATQVIFDTECGPPMILENYSGIIVTMDGPGTTASTGAGQFGYNITIQYEETPVYQLGFGT